MICPRCSYENRDRVKYCEECGARIQTVCPFCGTSIPLGKRFCGECGRELGERVEVEIVGDAGEDEDQESAVLLFDQDNFDAASGGLDPEEIKEITRRIFSDIGDVLGRYDRFLKRFIHDAAGPKFRLPEGAGLEGPDEAERARPGETPEEQSSVPVDREAGDTATEEADPEEDGRPAIENGEAVGRVQGGPADQASTSPGSRRNPSRRSSSSTGGPETGPMKDGEEPRSHEGEQSGNGRPIGPNGRTVLKADFVGREAELALLMRAAERLCKGRGSIVTICGAAGVGKTRLVEEFRVALDPGEVQWLQGHAYADSRDSPYFPLIDLLNRAWQIGADKGLPESRKKLELGVETLIGKNGGLLPYVGSLCGFSYPEAEAVSPEFWRSRLLEAVRALLTAVADRTPTVICLEDIHWADSATRELVYDILRDFKHRALVLCLHTPSFTLFDERRLSRIGAPCEEIRLQDLSPAEAHDVLDSLLKTEPLPGELTSLLVDGNPLYLTEVVNFLIESGKLVRNNGCWTPDAPIDRSEFPLTVEGVIRARLDLLEPGTKRLLQQASVIGTVFPSKILKATGSHEVNVDRCLDGLKRLDLIETGSFQSDSPYVFRHGLTREVAYNGLTLRERREAHERAALATEESYRERPSELCETLAFHFKRSPSDGKAVAYLMNSAVKSLKRFALDESHEYYKESFDLLADKPEKTKQDEELLVDLLIKWAMVFYYRGDFKGLTDLLGSHMDLVESLEDRARLGMFYAWSGLALYYQDKLRVSYQYLCKALNLGEETENHEVTACACAWLTWTCTSLGRLDEAILYGERAREMSDELPSDHCLYVKSVSGIGVAHCIKGEREKAVDAGKNLLDYGRRHSNPESEVMGHFVMGQSDLSAGNLASAAESCRKAVEISPGLHYSQFAKMLLGFAYALDGRFQEAEETLREVVAFGERSGNEITGNPARLILGAASVGKGKMSSGMKMLQDGRQTMSANGRRWFHAVSEYILGRIYSRIALGKWNLDSRTILGNLGFLVKEVPFAARKAEGHFNQAVKLAEGIGANGLLGTACLDLGLLYRAKGKKDRARNYLSTAVSLLERYGPETRLKEAQESLAFLSTIPGARSTGRGDQSSE